MNIKDINWKKLLSSIAIPVVVGAISGFLTRNSMDKYSALKQPFLAPPGWLFPIVWTILYVLMGISFYFVVTSDSAESSEKKKATIIYAIQLILNFIWTPVFFILDSYLLAFVILVFLWISIFKMISVFYSINKTAGLLQIPYLIWITFAGYLNLAIALLNR